MLEFIAKWWVEFLLVAVSGALIGVIERQIAINRGMMALLKDRIIQSYNYYKDKKYCPVYALESISDMFRQYQILAGKNQGAIPDLVNELKKLPHSREDGDVEG